MRLLRSSNVFQKLENALFYERSYLLYNNYSSIYSLDRRSLAKISLKEFDKDN
jgi:hypothetical protein